MATLASSSISHESFSFFLTLEIVLLIIWIHFLMEYFSCPCNDWSYLICLDSDGCLLLLYRISRVGPKPGLLLKKA